MGDSAPLTGLGIRRLQILGKCPIHLALEEIFAVDQQTQHNVNPECPARPLDRQYRPDHARDTQVTLATSFKDAQTHTRITLDQQRQRQSNTENRRLSLMLRQE